MMGRKAKRIAQLEAKLGRAQEDLDKLTQLGRAYIDSDYAHQASDYTMGEKLKGKRLRRWRLVFARHYEAQSAFHIELARQYYRRHHMLMPRPPLSRS